MASALPSLEFDDGQASLTGLFEVNMRLSTVGARLMCTRAPALPPAVAKVLATGNPDGASPSVAEEREAIMRAFAPDLKQLLDEIADAGRKPHVERGGHLDLQLAAGSTVNMINAAVNGLHVNCSDGGQGIDESFAVLRQLRDIHFFMVFQDGSCGHLTIPPAPPGQYWRFCFSALTPHYVFLDPAGTYIHTSLGPELKRPRFAPEEVPAAARQQMQSPAEKLGSCPFVEYKLQRTAAEQMIRRKMLGAMMGSRTMKLVMKQPKGLVAALATIITASMCGCAALA